MNLLQFPDDGLIYAVRPTELPPVADVAVSWPAALVLPRDSQNRNYLKPATENRLEVFALSPDGTAEEPVALEPQRTAERLAVTVPSVQTWTMVVLKRFYPDYDRERFRGAGSK